MRSRLGLVAAAVGLLAACAAPESMSAGSGPAPSTSTAPSASGVPSTGGAPSAGRTAGTAPDGRPFLVEEIAQLDEPWAMTFLPDGRALITGRGGELTLRSTEGESVSVGGVPEVVHEGQGGLGDVIAAPDFDATRHIYLSWAEAGDGGSGAAVGRATLAADGGSASLQDLTVLWRQPKVSGNGHYGHRLAFSPDGAHLFVSSGERQKMDPAQDLATNLGKIVRLDPDGTAAAGNPFAERGDVAAQVWSYGHRNPLGLAFDADGNLWNSEMGPQGGDELNLVRKGANYGWPRASNGSHYGGEDIPDHTADDDFEAPKASWNPSVSPGSLMIYSGSMFPQWQGDAFLGALSGEALIRVDLDGTDAAEGDTWELGQRVREVEQAPDGSIWLLTDEGQVQRFTAP
ncbi:MAG TPA: PQQ-dependent sugar dehydrogenase [Microlunatus sp.]|nr:PQQ-dependent sugar dehydrogenase [Microlunatus sp.]